MKVKSLIEQLNKFDKNCDVEIWIHTDEGYNNIGFRVEPDLDRTCKETVVEIHVGDHKYSSDPKTARKQAQREIESETGNILDDIEESL